MKKLIQKLSQFAMSVVLLGIAALPAHAFNSMYVFGDALSTTTNNTSGLSQYYSNRFCNGRVWVEVLAQRQGIPVANNWSYFDCNSARLLTNVQNFSITQQTAGHALFVVWCNNSDLYDIISKYGDSNPTDWTTNILRAQTNEFRAVTNLYAKGVRTVVMPGVVDLSEVPGFAMNYQSSYLKFIRQECSAYNTNFANTLNQLRTACPGLTIYEPNFFSLLDNVLTNAAYYGLTNALQNGEPIDALEALGNSARTNGLGANYVYWDYLDPSARFHAVIADVAQQVISPVQIAQVTALNNNSNQLAIVNVPMGLNGYIEGCTNLASPKWTTLQSINSMATPQSYFVPVPAPFQQSGSSSKQLHPNDITPPGPGGTVIVVALEYYRLHYPYAWNWP